MLQIILTLAIFVILVIPMGKYMYHIATKQKTFADKVFNPIDRCIYKVCGIKGEDMGWKKYALTLLLVNAVMVFVGYAILRLQSILFLNPNGISNMEPTLSFNTIISFMTNTNLQHYSGESGLSYVAQMCVIIFMMFTSAATGYAACMAFCRGLAVVETQKLLKGEYGFMCQYDDEPDFETIWSSIFDLSNLMIYRAEGDPRRKKFITDKRLHNIVIGRKDAEK